MKNAGQHSDTSKGISLTWRRAVRLTRFKILLYHPIDKKEFYNSPDCIENFIQLDDNDIWTALKVWSNHSDVVLSTLSRGMINRKLFKVEVTSSSITKARKEEILSRISKRLNINKKEAKYFLSISSIENNMYKKEDDSIEIIYKDGSTRDIAKASDMLNISLLSRKVKNIIYVTCVPKTTDIK